MPVWQRSISHHYRIRWGKERLLWTRIGINVVILCPLWELVLDTINPVILIWSTQLWSGNAFLEKKMDVNQPQSFALSGFAAMKLIHTDSPAKVLRAQVGPFLPPNCPKWVTCPLLPWSFQIWQEELLVLKPGGNAANLKLRRGAAATDWRSVTRARLRWSDATAWQDGQNDRIGPSPLWWTRPSVLSTAS